MVKPVLVSLLALLVALLLGCSDQEAAGPTVQAAREKPVQAEIPQPLTVVVPDDVAGHWKSVKIAVRDQQDGSEEIYAVDIGGSFRVDNSTLRIKVETFLPAFIMDGKRMTSSSNQATNPAAHIIIYDADTEIYRGWLFGLYPDTHAFQHPRYNFTLLGYKPAG